MSNIACIAYNSDKHEIEFIEQQTEWDGKWDKDVMYYDVLNAPAGLSIKRVRTALNFAMTTWDVEVDLDFHPVWFRKYRTKTPEITIEFKTPDEDKLFRDKPSVLAYAYYPKQGSVSGKIVFNANYNWGLNSGNMKVKNARKRGYIIKGDPDDSQWVKIYNIIQVLVHELGHMLGLKHDVSGNREGKDVMDAFYDGTRYDLSDRDIYRIHLKYIPEIFVRWSRYRLFKNWLRLRTRRFKLL